MAAKQVSAKHHILRALSKWPSDAIRPQIQFQDVLRKQIEENPSKLSEQEQLRQANALYSLLGNRYKAKYPIAGTLLKPKSNPTYFTDLVKELEEAPDRSFVQRMLLRLKGFVRMQ